MQARRRHAVTRTSGLSIALAACLLTLAAPAWAAAEGPCADLLVTHRPDGSTGRTDVVQITAQRIERGVDGWARVAWRTSPGTQLRAVEVVGGADGHTLPGDATVVEDGPVTELRFCGTADDTLAAAGDEVTATSAEGTAAGATDGGPTSERRGRRLGLALTGAGIGAAVGGVVLLLSRGARDDSEGIG